MDGFDGDTSSVKLDGTNSKVASTRVGGKSYADSVALAENDPEIRNSNRLMELLLWGKLERFKEYLADKKEKEANPLEDNVGHLNWNEIVGDLDRIKKTADDFTKKSYELSVLKEGQEYPMILRSLEEHFT